MSSGGPKAMPMSTELRPSARPVACSGGRLRREEDRRGSTDAERGAGRPTAPHHLYIAGTRYTLGVLAPPPVTRCDSRASSSRMRARSPLGFGA